MSWENERNELKNSVLENQESNQANKTWFIMESPVWEDWIPYLH